MRHDKRRVSPRDAPPGPGPPTCWVLAVSPTRIPPSSAIEMAHIPLQGEGRMWVEVRGWE